MKTVLITGSSRGIGKALALRLASEGYRMLIHGLSETEKAKQVVTQIQENGGCAQLVTADLRDCDSTRALAQKIGAVDVLILCASLQYKTPWEQITTEACYEQLNCNFISSMLLIQGVVPHMREKHWGRVITIGSVQEVMPHPDMLIYSASKAAQTNMVRSLAKQLAKDGITVNNVSPGVVYTDRNIEALSDPVYSKTVIGKIPAGYWAQPEDVASVVSMLCSEGGRYITGQSIYVDGGMSL